MSAALKQILTLACDAYLHDDLALAQKVEPLEQVVDYLRDRIKLNHVLRLQKNECTIEHGFVLSDLLTNFERVSDHCSNIAGCLIEITGHNALDVHKYLGEMKTDNHDFEEQYEAYKKQYAL